MTRKEFTPEDWKALYFVQRLFNEVAVHGKPALTKFMRALGSVSKEGE